jgi:hypothetical protein
MTKYDFQNIRIYLAYTLYKYKQFSKTIFYKNKDNIDDTSHRNMSAKTFCFRQSLLAEHLYFKGDKNITLANNNIPYKVIK